jgi:hypothetical protein
MLIYLILFFLLSPWILFFWFTITIQYLRGGIFWLLAITGGVTLPLDVFYNYSVFVVLMWDVPKKGEYTFSSRLERLVLRTDWRGEFARQIATCLNAICPTHNHIKNVINFQFNKQP